MWDKRNLRCSYPKSKLAGWHEDGKNIFSKKLQIKTNFDNATGILKNKANIIWSVKQFQILFYWLLYDYEFQCFNLEQP